MCAYCVPQSAAFLLRAVLSSGCLSPVAQAFTQYMPDTWSGNSLHVGAASRDSQIHSAATSERGCRGCVPWEWVRY